MNIPAPTPQGARGQSRSVLAIPVVVDLWDFGMGDGLKDFAAWLQKVHPRKPDEMNIDYMMRVSREHRLLRQLVAYASRDGLGSFTAWLQTEYPTGLPCFICSGKHWITGSRVCVILSDLASLLDRWPAP